MRIAFISDVHANIQALGAVLLDIHTIKMDAIICLGDVVGYGPSPAEALETVCSNAAHCLLGNHDAALCGKLSAESFTDEAKELLAWTRTRLTKSALKFLANLPLTVAAPGFRCAHGEFSQPSFFRYLLKPEDAIESWNRFPEQIMFVGHTHMAGIAVMGRSGTPHMIAPEDFCLEQGKRYIVNPGSVGNPRDGDPRASYCFYDTTKGAVYWRRLPFDLDAYRKTLVRAGVPESASPFLQDDPLAKTKRISVKFGFNPPSRDEDAAHGAVEVKTIALLRRSAARWRRAAAALLLFLAAAAAALFFGWTYGMPHPRRIIGEKVILLPDPSQPPAAESELLFLPPAPAQAGAPIPGWTACLGDFRRQSVRYEELEPGVLGFALKSGGLPAEALPLRRLRLLADTLSGAPAELNIVSQPVAVSPEMRLQFSALCRKSPDFSGSVCFEVLLMRDAENEDAFAPEQMERLRVKEPNLPRAGGWLGVQDSFNVPARGAFAAIRVSGRFTGTAWIKELRLLRRRPAPSEAVPATHTE